jgi:uncharacterized protein (TIGR04222 family)
MSRVWLGAAALIIMLLLPATAAAQTGQRSVSWQRYDADLAVQTDGSLNVTETQAITFSGTAQAEPYQNGFRVVPDKHSTGIGNVRVGEIVNGQLQPYSPGAGVPGTYSTSPAPDGLSINWTFPQTLNATRTFVISYTVRGAVAIYNAGDQIDWNAIYADRSGPVDTSSVTVRLPAAADPNQLKSALYFPKPKDTIGALPAAGTGQIVDDQTVHFAPGQLAPYVGAEVRVQFPHGMVTTSPPPWQAEADNAARMRQTVAPIAGFLSLLVGLGLLAGGGVTLFVLWFTRGRDPNVGTVPPIIEAPPSDLPAPLAGTLVDEVADVQDAVATLVDLAQRGFLTLADGADGRDVEVTLTASVDDERLRRYERVLLNAIFGPKSVSGQTMALSQVRASFGAAIPVIQERLNTAVQEEGLFVDPPEAIRRRYRGIGTFLAIAGAIVAVVAALAIGWATPLATFAGLALAVVGLATIWVAGRMPRRTPQGALDAARWRAFRTYLLQTYPQRPAARGQSALDTTYLPYAVALGVDRSFLSRLERLGSPPPAWYPYPSTRRGPGGVIIVPGGYYGGGPWIGGPTRDGGAVGPGPGGGGGPTTAPSPQGWSDALADLLNAASGAMSSGGGSGDWSGGGFGGGDGGGGGSGGFS